MRLDVKNLPDRMTISLRFFLEKLAIYRIFHCKNVVNTGSKQFDYPM
nr:hypothetical protein [uncultured Moraxella sp.]